MTDPHEFDAAPAANRHHHGRNGGGPRRGSAVLVAVATALVVLGAGPSVSTAATESPSESAPTSDSSSASPGTPSSSSDSAEAEELTVGGMLVPRQLRPLAPIRRWRTVATTDNTDGDGLVLPCQQSRFADDQSSGALLRSFVARPQENQPRMQAWQFTERSQDAARARAGFNEVQDWYAGCAAPRMQLLETRKVPNVGNDATLFWLRSWRAPVTTYVVGVARTGKVTTTTVAARADATAPDLAAHTSRLAAAVNALCGASGSGRCASPPSSRIIDPLPTGVAPGMLSEIDLPPVRGVRRRWVGTEPSAARQNFAATQCDETTFGQEQGVTNALTRTFVVPGGDVPDEFGLTQTVGTLPAGRATDFFAGIRGRVLGCGGEDSGTSVESLSFRRDGGNEVIVWRMRITISEEETVPYLMGIARNGTAVSQIGFFPAGSRTTGPSAFVRLLERAQRRLGQMPKPVTAPNKPAGSKTSSTPGRDAADDQSG